MTIGYIKISVYKLKIYQGRKTQSLSELVSFSKRTVVEKLLKCCVSNLWETNSEPRYVVGYL